MSKRLPERMRCTDCNETKPYTVEYFASKNGRLYGRCIPCDTVYFDRLNRYFARVKRDDILRKANRKQQKLLRETIRQRRGLPVSDHTREGNIAYQQNLRALKMRVDGVITGDDVRLQKKSQNGLCWWCDKPHGDNWQLDHRVPLSRAGTNTAGNICCACRHCNASKHNYLPYEWNGRLL
jgi:hypothetical protein